MGKLGCVVDISQKGKSNSLASEFSKVVARLIATDNSKLVCLDLIKYKTFLCWFTEKFNV